MFCFDDGKKNILRMEEMRKYQGKNTKLVVTFLDSHSYRTRAQFMVGMLAVERLEGDQHNCFSISIPTRKWKLILRLPSTTTQKRNNISYDSFWLVSRLADLQLINITIWIKRSPEIESIFPSFLTVRSCVCDCVTIPSFHSFHTFLSGCRTTQKQITNSFHPSNPDHPITCLPKKGKRK